MRGSKRLKPWHLKTCADGAIDCGVLVLFEEKDVAHRLVKTDLHTDNRIAKPEIVTLCDLLKKNSARWRNRLQKEVKEDTEAQI